MKSDLPGKGKSCQSLAKTVRNSLWDALLSILQHSIWFQIFMHTYSNGPLQYLLQIWKDIKLRQDRRRQSINASTTIRHQARRRQEDNLAVVFMGIVGAFLLCHLLRIALRYPRRILSLIKFVCEILD